MVAQNSIGGESKVDSFLPHSPIIVIEQSFYDCIGILFP